MNVLNGNDGNGRIVLLTGVSGGIGAATAAHFAKAGWRVLGVDIAEPTTPLAGLERLFIADVGDETAVRQLCVTITQDFGFLDALINNAAVQVSKRLIDTTLAEWDAVMRVNLRGVYLIIRAAYPLLRQRAGAIVNVSSVHAVATSAGIAAYAASKGGLLALTRALAIELATDDLRVNAVLPGAVDTPMLEDGLRRDPFEAVGPDLQAQKAALANRTVIGRVGSPAEIARAIYFLADNQQSSFMTGQALIIDGGATARLSTE